MADKQIVTKPQHGEPIGFAEGKPVIASPNMQTHLDDLTQRLNENSLGTASWLPSYVKASLPASTDLPDATEAWMIFVSDDVGGSTPAFWDGTAWRRTSDRNVIS